MTKKIENEGKKYNFAIEMWDQFYMKLIDLYGIPLEDGILCH